MTNYQTIKNDYRKTLDDLITKHGVFYAFNNRQLDEGKDKIGVLNNNELTTIGGGGFIKKINFDAFIADINQATKNYKKELKLAKEAKDEAILYELNNYEAFYTGRIDETVDHFAGIYTAKDIQKVFNKNDKK